MFQRLPGQGLSRRYVPATADQRQLFCDIPFMTSPLMRKTSLRLLGGATALATSLTLVACGGGEQAGGDFDGEV